MIDTPTSNNIGDFKQRYLGVFGWLCANDQRRVVYISGVNNKQVTFTDVDGAQFFALIDSGVNFEFAPVTRGWYATPDNTYYVTRIPARQWKRGISEENTRVTNAISPDYELHGEAWKVAVFNILLNQDFNSVNPEIRPLSKHFCKLFNGLYLYNTAIGKFVGDTVILNNDMFRQEFTDLVRRKNLNLEVV